MCGFVEYIYFFFFSSRRRHTRSLCDWSSDVCSSDLPGSGVFGRTAMDWVDRGAYQPPGMELLGHAGGAGSYHAWVGFDKKQSRGVVVLTTANDVSSEAIGWTLLQRLPLKRDNVNEFAKEIVGLGFAFDLDKKTHTLLVTK